MSANPPRRGSYDDLFEAVRLLFASYYHGWTPDQIVIRAWAPQPNDKPQEKHFELHMPATPPPDITGVQGEVLDALGDEWLHGKQIAKAIGYSYSGYLKAVLADMVEKELLEHGPQGYHAKDPGP